ncbi:hypothetical protein LOCC1_G000878 [Lachnellula occidentalis]|uniref:Nitrogen regulatory protein areA GATA-like domain-containing protein n=1 Tax=Lachnellula occidentalis TaxID=215460 RepID=A0A8H8S7J1_9HELO|nr:hypothetical protein LOCC1_G000878 [Lachnellula occidentalis]
MSFVKNAPGIEGSIESVDINPLDPADIARLWKVYTTTKRRLLDPTAERLENYWWRIWGSRKRELKGAMVARLFAQISDGHTFVPLGGPPNVDAIAPPLESNNRFRSGAASATALHQPSHSSPNTTSSSSIIPRASTALPHPILKKTRGPSTSGPRPTARFVSPHESERETEPDSPTSTNSHVVVQPPSPDPESIRNGRKSSVPPGPKKTTGFVASSAAKKKRPVVVRRQSSQNSQSSTDSPHPSGSTQTPSQRTPTASEQAQARSKHTVPSKFQENFSPSSRSSASSSTQKHRAASKDRTASKASDSKRNLAHKTSVEKGLRSRRQEAAEAGPSDRLRLVEDQQDTVEDLTSGELEQHEMQRALLEQANASTEKPLQSPSKDRAQLQQKPLKSRSDNDRSGDTGGLRMLPHNSKLTTSAAPTLTTATANGQLDLKDPTVEKSGRNFVSTSSPSIDKGKGRDSDDTGAFTKRAVQPVAQAEFEPTGPLSRSKSQLTLLLEKDRSRGSGDPTSNGKKT